MAGIVFIGDEVSAAGYRLAGAEVLCPAPQAVADVFVDVCARADAVMVTAEAAAHLPAERLAEAQAMHRPMVLVVTDVRGHTPPPDLETQVHNVLGLET